MFALQLSLLTGRYVATAYNARGVAEWPPHPARLFSALAAAHFECEVPDAQRREERRALEWLERCGPPLIAASPAATREVVTVFVPVNDVALTNVDDEAEALEDARATVAAAQSTGDARALRRATTALRRAEDAFKRAVARATQPPARPVSARLGEIVLPDRRVRQPRTFPSVTPEDPHVTYLWPDAEAEADCRDALAALARRVVRVGHSSSLVSLRVLETTVAEPAWHPDVTGETNLRVPGPGQLAALEDAFSRHGGIEPRVLPALQQPYTARRPRREEDIRASVFSDRWLILRRIGGPQLPMTAAAGVARAVRAALMSFGAQPVPEIISGHTPDGQPSTRPHMAVVPIPFVGHQHATGHILGIALILPSGLPDGERALVYSAVAAWEARYRREDEDTPAIDLQLGAAGVLTLERVEWQAIQTSLRADTWCGPSATWVSATPVALDRNPGNLRSREAAILERATAEARETIAAACEHIGLPRPAHAEILPAAPMAGAAKSRHYPPYPNDRARTTRVLTHVRIDFDQPVSGPVLLGAGRYVGLGLCRPWSAA